MARGNTDRRSGVPWWAPLLALAVLVAGVTAGIVATRKPARTAAPAAATTARPMAATTTNAVLGAQKTRRTKKAAAVTAAQPMSSARGDRSLTAAGQALLPIAANRLQQLEGRYAHARSVRVGDVVGDRVFWVGNGASARLLVHLQGSGTRFAVRRGQRLSFTAVVTRNKPGAAGAWGVTSTEGKGQLTAERYHLEVFGPRIRFVCVAHCARHGR